MARVTRMAPIATVIG